MMNIYPNIMFWCVCIIVGYAFWICVDVACAVHITIVTHKPASEQIHHHCHTLTCTNLDSDTAITDVYSRIVRTLTHKNMAARSRIPEMN